MHMNFYGLEICKKLKELGKRLWPCPKNSFFNGNAFTLRPERKFDYVYTCDNAGFSPYTSSRFERAVPLNAGDKQH
jgi:hypothetical protein